MTRHKSPGGGHKSATIVGLFAASVFAWATPQIANTQSASFPIPDEVLTETYNIQIAIQMQYAKNQSYDIDNLRAMWDTPENWSSDVKVITVSAKGEIVIEFNTPAAAIVTWTPVLSDDRQQVAAWHCDSPDIHDIGLSWPGCQYSGKAKTNEELNLIVAELSTVQSLITIELYKTGLMPEAGKLDRYTQPDWQGTRVDSLELLSEGQVALRLTAHAESPAGTVYYTPDVNKATRRITDWTCHSPDIPDINDFLDRCVYRP